LFPKELVNLLCTHPSIDKFDAEFAMYVAKGEKFDQNDKENDPMNINKLLKFLLAPVKQSSAPAPPDNQTGSSLLSVPLNTNTTVHRRSNSKISNNREN
tara:strand:- start:125 stop:421 length:297 start_codon:yes stop_codon:yes gene_type:complete